MPLPLVPLIIGGSAVVGGLTVANAIDDNVIDPLTGQTDRPIVSDRIMLVAGVALAAFAARKAGLI